jgi:predicted RNA-binding protein with RPS1 domain
MVRRVVATSPSLGPSSTSAFIRTAWSISELSNRYIKDPSEAVKADPDRRVKVLYADVGKRIALSRKALMGPAPSNQRQTGEQPQAQPTMNKKVAVIQVESVLIFPESRSDRKISAHDD